MPNAGGHLSPALETEVREVAGAALTRNAARLGLDGVDVALYVSPWDLPETGIFGYAPLAHFVEIRLNPKNPRFAAGWRAELPATVAHELHHARRWQGPGYDSTLLEGLVREGLAQMNELAERNGELPPYARARVDLDALWTRALPLLDRTDYGHAAWFFGSETEGLPRWGGYTLGYELVRRHLARVGGDVAGHVHTAARDFREAW